MKARESLVAGNLHRFDIISLLGFLWFIGYRPDEIRFRSNDSITSQGGLIHGIAFESEPSRCVTITLNLGLASAQSPLPTYMRKKMDSEIEDVQAFLDFLGFFDHKLIHDYLSAIYPETNTALYPDWESSRRRYLFMLDLKSRSVLHWLFQTVFPELGLNVEKAVLNRSMRAIPIVLGKTALGGDALFGGMADTPVHGRRVTLYAESELTNRAEPWPREIKRRLEEQIFPLLRPVGMDIDIFLVIQSQNSWARLHSESFLGYDRLRGGKRQHRRLRIFQGHLSE